MLRARLRQIMINPRNAIGNFEKVLSRKGCYTRLLRRAGYADAEYIILKLNQRYYIIEFSETYDLKDIVCDMPDLCVHIGGLFRKENNTVDVVFYIFLAWTSDIADNIVSELKKEENSFLPLLKPSEVEHWIASSGLRYM